MSRFQTVVLAFALAGLGAACQKKSEAAAMPPASGPGAAALPSLPKIDGAGSVGPSEGRTTGTTYARDTAEVGPSVTGVISEAKLREGDRVKKGEVLFKLDTRDAALRLDQAKAGLTAAQINLKATEIEANRIKTLVGENAVNRAQGEQIELRLEGAKNGVEQAALGVQMAEKFLADNIVRAPFDGVITEKRKSAGEMAPMMPPTVVYVLQDQTLLEIRFRLPEQDLARVKPGDPIDARFTALGLAREAKIVRLSPTVDARSRTFEAVAEIPNADGALRPGLLAEIGYGQPTVSEEARK